MEVGELHLGDGTEAPDRRADRDPHDARLGDGRVDDAVRPELLDEAVRDAEHPAADANVLAEEDEALVAAELLEQRVVHRLDVRLDGHRRTGGAIGGKSCGRRSRMIA